MSNVLAEPQIGFHQLLSTFPTKAELDALDTDVTQQFNDLLADIAANYAAISHTHDAADIVSGVLDNARVNWAAPGAIGGTTPAAGAFDGLQAIGNVNFGTPPISVLQVLNIRTPSSPYLGLNIQDSSGNDRWSFYDTGGAFMTAAPATVGAPTQNPGTWTWTSRYWNGSASVNEVFRMRSTRFSANAGHFDMEFADNSNTVVLAMAGAGGQVSIGYAFPSNALLGTLGQLHVRSLLATTPTLTLRGAASQSANLQEWQDSGGNVLGSIAASGVVLHRALTSATSTPTIVGIFGSNTTGTPANGGGTGIGFQGESSTTENVDMAAWLATWGSVTHASRTARLLGRIYNASGSIDQVYITETGFGVGRDPARKFHVGDPSTAYIHLTTDATGHGASNGSSFVVTTDLTIVQRQNANMILSTNGTERLRITGAGEVTLPAANGFYFGDASTNGSWRIIRDGNNIKFQRRESGSWVDKSTISA